MLDEFLSLGPMVKLIDALSYMRGLGDQGSHGHPQSEAQPQALYGREHAEFFIDNHRARIYYRPPTHCRDLAEGLARIAGQCTVKQTSYSYGLTSDCFRQNKEGGGEVRAMIIALIALLAGVEASYPVGSFCEDKPSGREEHLLEGQRLRLQPQSLQIEGDGREGRHRGAVGTSEVPGKGGRLLSPAELRH